MSDATANQFIDDYYQEEFISELNLEELRTWYEFNTSKHDEDYSVAAGSYYVVGTPIYIDGTSIDLYVDPASFYSAYPQQVTKEKVSDGDGSMVAFTDTLKTPVNPGTVVVDDNVETFSDDGAGTLTGDEGGSGTINYTTGALSVTFNTAPTASDDVDVTYEYWSTGAPVAALWDSYNSQIILRPVPDKLYKVKMYVSIVPTAFSSDSSTPVYDDWGPVIAYGAAMNILSEYEGEDVAIRLRDKYEEKLNFANRRFVRQFEGVRAEPSF
jgi:hypothetical protein